MRKFSSKEEDQDELKKLTIDCISHIEIVWNSVTEKTLTKCWKPLWPNLFKEYENSGELKDSPFSGAAVDAVIRDGK